MTHTTGAAKTGATDSIHGIDTDKGAARTVGTSAIVPQAAHDGTGRHAHDDARTAIGGHLG